MIFLIPIINVLISVLDLLLYGLVTYVILGWLVAFDVVNPHNRFVAVVGDLLTRLLEPILYKIRSYVPTFNGIDFSTLALFLLIKFAQTTLMLCAIKLLSM